MKNSSTYCVAGPPGSSFVSWKPSRFWTATLTSCSADWMSYQKLPEGSTPKGKTRLNSGATLDLLYASILRAGFSKEDPEVD